VSSSKNTCTRIPVGARPDYAAFHHRCISPDLHVILPQVTCFARYMFALDQSLHADDEEDDVKPSLTPMDDGSDDDDMVPPPARPPAPVRAPQHCLRFALNFVARYKQNNQPKPHRKPMALNLLPLAHSRACRSVTTATVTESSKRKPASTYLVKWFACVCISSDMFL
jgi:hypothetical protein